MAEILERPYQEPPRQPTRHRLDVEAYYRMAETGILVDPAHTELIDGEIFDMPAIGSPHAGITNRLNRLFGREAADNLILVAVQNPLRLDRFNEPEPDLMLLRPRADDYRASHPSAADVLLLVEVADTSLGYDRAVKLPLYARFGVPEVWIVDIAGAAVEVFRELRDGAYSHAERRAGGMLSPTLVPSVEIEFAALFV
jgi:Uma2 family endonuclease